MRIIKKIEINYFRSTYSVDLKDVSDLNILIGGNDSGKSNILRALNLFFNNETELGQNFYFPDDLTRKREQEARDAKGRATIWMKIHFNNFLKWKSLPKDFSIKKVWNRYTGTPEIIYPTGIKTTSVVKFLNKLSFHYVPAVRGREIFNYFLTILHDALLDDEKAGLLTSTQDLIETININTKDMSKRILNGVGIESNVQPPTNLRFLFNALDFSTGYSGHSVPLQKRGDGIQSRHIPFILDFVARHSKTYHIWAYEEPETSLEMGPAFELAKQFDEDFSKENQVFLTTHSPAFYDLSGQRTSKWFVYQKIVNEEYETKVEKVSSDDLIDSHLGVAALIADRAKEAYDQIEELSKTVDRLDKTVAENNMPHVVVEGKTDVKILESAFRKLFPNSQFFCNFIHAGGATNITNYLKTARVLSKELPHPIIGLFDRDAEGIKQMKELKNKKQVGENDFASISKDRQIYAGTLPLHSEIKEIENEIKENIEKNFTTLPVPIEYMFPTDIVNRAVEEGYIGLDDRIAKANDPEFPTDINITEELSKVLPKEYQYFSQKVRQKTKVKYADWVVDLDKEYFKYFVPLFEQLKEVINE